LLGRPYLLRPSEREHHQRERRDPKDIRHKVQVRPNGFRETADKRTRGELERRLSIRVAAPDEIRRRACDRDEAEQEPRRSEGEITRQHALPPLCDRRSRARTTSHP